MKTEHYKFVQELRLFVLRTKTQPEMFIDRDAPYIYSIDIPRDLYQDLTQMIRGLAPLNKKLWEAKNSLTEIKHLFTEEMYTNFEDCTSRIHSVNSRVFIDIIKYLLSNIITAEMKTSHGFSKNNIQCYNNIIFKIGSTATETTAYAKLQILSSKECITQILPIVPQSTPRGKLYHIVYMNRLTGMFEMSLCAHALDRLNLRECENEKMRQQVLDVLAIKMLDCSNSISVQGLDNFHIFVNGGLLLGDGVAINEAEKQNRNSRVSYVLLKTYISQSMFTPEQLQMQEKEKRSEKSIKKKIRVSKTKMQRMR
jgi:hypothetical protein